MGREGNQASLFSDFAVPHFKDLRRLAFWHGAIFGGRLVTFVNSILFKNFILLVTYTVANFYNGFSGFV